MESSVKNILVDVFDIKEADISNEMNLRDIESWDSLKHMNLVVSLEQQFNIEFSTEEIIEMKKLNDLYNILKRKDIQAQ